MYSMIINSSYHREQALRSLERGHPYYSHASQALGENLQKQKLKSPLPFQKNIVSLIHKESRMGGSGIFLNKEGFLLTSFHLVDHLKRNRYHMRDYVVRESSGREYALDQSFFADNEDEGKDLALLRALKPHEDLSPTPIALRNPAEGEKIVYFPFPNGLVVGALEGIVQDWSCDIEIQKKNGSKYLREDSFVFSGKGDVGYSGSAIFSLDGEFLGTLFGGENPGRSSDMFAIKSKYASRLVQSVRDHLCRC